MKKLIIILAIFIILALGVSAECIEPQELISENTVFCEGEYYLPKGIVITAENIILDCNNAVIKGNFAGTGIDIKEKENVEIYNCNVQDFDTGINIEDSTLIIVKDSSLVNNKVGMRIINSFENSILNIHDESVEKPVVITNSKSNTINLNKPVEECVDNICSEITDECLTGDNYCPNECDYETDRDCEKQAVIEDIKPEKENKNNEIPETITNDKNSVKNIVSIRKYNHLYADKSVEITKTRTIKENKTTFETKIKAKEDIKGLVLYEYFPKEVANHVRDIKFYEKMILVEEDPIVKKEIGNMKKDEVITITYDIEKIINGNTNPSSIVTIEKSTTIVNLLASISYILAVYIVLVLVKRHKVDKLVKDFKKTTEKLYGVPFPVAYIVLMLIPKINYSLLMSENCAILFYIIIIKLEFWTLYFLVKHKSPFYYIFRGWRKVKKT